MTHLQNALHLARMGYYVHPLAEHNKIPIAEHGYNDATRDEDQIRMWWQERPHANVGICLHKSGIVDVAPDSLESAATFKAKGLPATVCYTSGGGVGHWHTWYRLPKGGPVARACVPGQYDVMSEGNAVAPGSIHPSGRAYTLQTALLPVEDLPPAPAWVIELLEAHVTTARVDHDAADWSDIPSGATLASSARFRTLVNANQQLEDVVSGEGVTLTLKDGAKDNSPSIQRAVFVNQLLRARFPHTEIRALALHFRGVLESKPKWFKADIDNLLRPVDQGGYTPKDYTPEPTRGMTTTAEPPRGGRHYEITAAELLDRYHEYADCGRAGIVLQWTISEAAEHLGVSTGTIKRREAELIEAGKMRREYGRVILSPATWAIGSQCFDMPQTATTDTSQGEAIADPAIFCDAKDVELAEPQAQPAIGSQPNIPHADAPNVPKTGVCIDQAHVEITHPSAAPAEPDEWADIERDVADWMRTTSDGRHFAQIQRQQAATAARIEALRGTLHPQGRDLLSQVRNLARQVAEPGWYLRDYDAWDVRRLSAERARLSALAPVGVGECVLSRACGPPISRAEVLARIERHGKPYELRGAELAAIMADSTDTTFTWV